MMSLRGMIALMILTIGVGLAVGWRIGHPAAAAGPMKTVSVLVQKFDFQPAEIRLKKGEPVMLELTSYDRLHGFYVPDLKLRVDVLPDQTVQVPLTPDTAGRFAFRCDIFCGDGHEDMEGVIIVED